MKDKDKLQKEIMKIRQKVREDYKKAYKEISDMANKLNEATLEVDKFLKELGENIGK